MLSCLGHISIHIKSCAVKLKYCFTSGRYTMPKLIRNCKINGSWTDFSRPYFVVLWKTLEEKRSMTTLSRNSIRFFQSYSIFEAGLDELCGGCRGNELKYMILFVWRPPTFFFNLHLSLTDTSPRFLFLLLWSHLRFRVASRKLMSDSHGPKWGIPRTVRISFAWKLLGHGHWEISSLRVLIFFIPIAPLFGFVAGNRRWFHRERKLRRGCIPEEGCHISCAWRWSVLYPLCNI